MQYNDVYNENNLKAEDKKAIELMEMAMDEALNATVSDLDLDFSKLPTIEALIKDVAEAVKADVRANFETIVYEIVVSMIEGYEEGDNEA